jgi:hypothetical protein
VANTKSEPEALMASAKQKAIVARLEQIKAQASALNAAAKTDDAGGQLAEEAAELGLELFYLLKEAK